MRNYTVHPTFTSKNISDLEIIDILEILVDDLTVEPVNIISDPGITYFTFKTWGPFVWGRRGG